MEMNLFAIASLSTCVATGLILAVSLLADRALVLKPSVIFLGLFWLQVQAASAINTDYITKLVPEPWHYFLIVQALPCLLAVITRFTFRREARALSARLFVEEFGFASERVVTAAILVAAVYGVVVVYFTYIDFRETGLYALLFEPEVYDVYREQSLKLINSNLLPYLFAFMEKTLAPVTAACLTLLMLYSLRRFRLPAATGFFLVLLLVLFPTTLHGARGPAAMIALSSVFAAYLYIGAPRRLSVLILAFAVVLAPAIGIMLIKGGEFSSDALEFQTFNILDRAVGRGFKTNAWYVGYVQEHGFFGIDTTKLAEVFGRERVNSLNIVGRYFKPGAPSTISASVAFPVFDYGNFGIWALPFSIIACILLDTLLYLYRFIAKPLLIPCLAATAVPLLSLSFTPFTTSLVSKGLLLIPLLGIISTLVLETLRMHDRAQSGVVAGRKR